MTLKFKKDDRVRVTLTGTIVATGEGAYENTSRRGTIRRCPIVLLKD